GRLGRVGLAPQDRLHQRPVVRHHRALAGVEVVRLGPAEPDADAQVADLGVLVDAARIARHVQARNADAAAGARDLHQRVEHRRGPFHDGLAAVAARLEADAVDAAVDLRDAENLLDLLAERG